MQEKLRVGFLTSSLLAKTGFSTMARCLLPYLYKTGKYEIFHLNQSISDGHNEFLRYPWHNEGVFKKGTFDEARFNNPNEEAYRRHVSYGNEAVESFIIRNKLQVLILQEDGWAYEPSHYLRSKWYSYIKDNVLLHTTIDSLKILPLYKEWAENCPSMWTWASFAAKELHRENFQKYGHVRHVFGSLDTKEYYPISKQKKLELRKQFNIDPNCKIFIQLGRNQLRKIFPASLESFSKFKKQYPEYNNSKLLFHCFFAEPAGWPLARLIEEFGINKEDVLATYYCKHCKRWEIKFYQGEELDCKFCGNQKKQFTAGVDSTITNEELSLIYGISDASLSIFTSAGLELNNPQSLLCGLPLLCSEYSAGDDFVCNDFVFKLDGNHTYECGTGFIKHVPNLNTMVKFYKKICEMSEEKRLEIGKLGRDWALKTFDISVIGKAFEEWLDSRKPHGWDFVYKPEKSKNPQSQIPNIEDNIEWLKTMYLNILNMSVDEKDSGLISWVERLKMGQPRHEIEKFFRDTAFNENIKIQQQQNQQQYTNPLEPYIEKNGRKRFLLVIKESLGDCINVAATLKSLKEQYQDYDIYVCTDPKNFEIFDGNPYIFRCIPYHQIAENELICTGQGNNKGLFDGFCHVAIGAQRILSYLSHDNIALNLQ